MKELGGKMNIWNLSLHRDFVLTEKLSHGKSLFEDFTCIFPFYFSFLAPCFFNISLTGQTVIILNNEIEEFWDGRRVSNSHEYLRSTRKNVVSKRFHPSNFNFYAGKLISLMVLVIMESISYL